MVPQQLIHILPTAFTDQMANLGRMNSHIMANHLRQLHHLHPTTFAECLNGFPTAVTVMAQRMIRTHHKCGNMQALYHVLVYKIRV